MQTFPEKTFLPFLVQGTEQGWLQERSLCRVQAERRRAGSFSCLGFSQSPSAQSRPYGKVGYFREASSDTPPPPRAAVPAELRQWETWPEEGPHADQRELVPRRRWIGNACVVASMLRGPCGPGSHASRAPALNPARDPGRGHEGCHVGIWWWGHSSAQDRLLQGNQCMLCQGLGARLCPRGCPVCVEVAGPEAGLWWTGTCGPGARSCPLAHGALWTRPWGSLSCAVADPRPPTG